MSECVCVCVCVCVRMNKNLSGHPIAQLMRGLAPKHSTTSQILLLNKELQALIEQQ